MDWNYKRQILTTCIVMVKQEKRGNMLFDFFHKVDIYSIILRYRLYITFPIHLHILKEYIMYTYCGVLHVSKNVVVRNKLYEHS